MAIEKIHSMGNKTALDLGWESMYFSIDYIKKDIKLVWYSGVKTKIFRDRNYSNNHSKFERIVMAIKTGNSNKLKLGL